MGLSAKYTLAVGRIPDLFDKIRDGQAPEQFTRQLLKDWGFTSSNDHAFIPILKELGFLTPDGKPTGRYHSYRDHSRSKTVMAEGLREAYGDIFLIKEHPTGSDRVAIEGKFKSFHNVSDNVAGLMTKNFMALLKLSDLKSEFSNPDDNTIEDMKNNDVKTTADKPINAPVITPPIPTTGLHYNIQIHLPATKDVEVYNAIFKSLREHLFER